MRLFEGGEKERERKRERQNVLNRITCSDGIDRESEGLDTFLYR